MYSAARRATLARYTSSLSTGRERCSGSTSRSSATEEASARPDASAAPAAAASASGVPTSIMRGLSGMEASSVSSDTPGCARAAHVFVGGGGRRRAAAAAAHLDANDLLTLRRDGGLLVEAAAHVTHRAQLAPLAEHQLDLALLERDRHLARLARRHPSPAARWARLAQPCTCLIRQVAMSTALVEPASGTRPPTPRRARPALTEAPTLHRPPAIPPQLSTPTPPLPTPSPSSTPDARST